MYKIIGILLSVLISTLGLNAQKLEIGGGIGFTNYQGDLSDAIFIAKEAKPAFSAHVKYAFMPKFAVRGQIMLGAISGSDANSDDLAYRGYAFSSSVTEFSGMLEYRILDKTIYNDVGEFHPNFSPYIFMGLGYTSANATLSFSNPDPRYSTPEPEDVNSFISMPMGLGLRYHFTDFLAIGVEFGQRYVFSDYLDNVAKTGNPNKKDWYMYGNFHISYIISKGANYLGK
jgi:Domain of unknown function (DUF6089)